MARADPPPAFWCHRGRESETETHWGFLLMGKLTGDAERGLAAIEWGANGKLQTEILTLYPSLARKF